MREELLESLVCPACEKSSWRLECHQPRGGEVVQEGRLLCTACGAFYSISKGIVDLLPHPDDLIMRERAGWCRLLEGSPAELDDAWLLALPRIDESVTSHAESIAHWKRQADNFEYLMGHLDLSGGHDVLELGAGRCWASAYLAQRGCRVVALDVVGDIKAGGLETGSVYLDHGTAYFERVLASMEKLPFRQETFDLVLSVASIHHSALLDQVVWECSRVLRPGGKLLLTSEPCIRIFKERRVQNLETDLGINEHVYNVLDYTRAFRKAGLRPSFSLPGALVAMLTEESPPTEPGRIEARLFRLASRMWKREAVRRLLCSQAIILVGLALLEYGLTAIVEKELSTQAR